MVLEVRPLTLYIAVECTRINKLWHAQVRGYPETFCQSEYKHEAVDAALKIAKDKIWPEAQM